MSLPILKTNLELNRIGEKKTIEKTRKRTRNPDQHKIFQQKVKVQKGLEYETKSGKTVKAKIFKNQTKCDCKNECAEKIDSNRQKEIFDIFYGLKNRSEKIFYLRSLTKCLSMKDDLKSVRCNAKKSKYKYFLTNFCGEHKEVCFKFFLQCFQVSSSTLDRAIKSVVLNESAIELRGRFPTRKTKETDLIFVKKFIRKFPCYSSHYGASQSNKKYLNPNMNIKRMYKEYCMVCEFSKRKIVSEWKFRHVFNTSFNLAFHPKKVDSCRKCDKFKAEIDSERTNTVKKLCLMQQRRDHWQIVKKIKRNFEETKNLARDETNHIEKFTYDLQRALELPSITTCEAYYRRQLWVYNLCILDEKRDKAYMYVWNESIASRGAQEITSCLIKHFENYVPPETEEIILNSDACPGQNRNIKTTLMLKKCLDSWPHSALKSIEQRYFVSGHSYNGCDRSFGLIERQKKNTESIFTPDHWVNIIAQAKKNEPKFTVIKMTKEDFFSSKQTEEAITNRKMAKNGEKVNWLNMQKIVNNKTNPFEITVERYNTSPLVEISFRKRGKAGRLTTSLSDFDLVPLYTKYRAIKRKKYDDLMKLMEYVPAEFHAFYEGLHSDDKNQPKKKNKKIFESSDEES